MNTTVLLEASTSSSTRETYQSSLKNWKSFQLFINQKITHVSEQHIEMYLNYRYHCSSVLFPTVSKELSAIADHCVRNDFEFPNIDKHTRISKMKTGFKRLRPGGSGKTPLPVSTLRNEIKRIKSYRKATDMNAALKVCVLSFAFVCMQRVGMYTAKDQKSQCPIQTDDLEFEKQSGVLKSITIWRDHSKTNQFKNKELSPLTCSCQIKICSLHSVEHYLKLRSKNISDQNKNLFVFRDGSVLTESKVRKWVKDLVEFEGLNPKEYSSHSLRKGGACLLFSQGISLDKVEKLGMWKEGSTALRQCYLLVSLINESKSIWSQIKM